MSPADDFAVNEPSSLVGVLRVVRERWWIIALAVIACTGIAIGLSVSSEKTYEASSKILVRQSQVTGLIQAGSQPNVDPQRQQGTALLLVTSQAVAERVKKRLNLPESADSLLGEVSAEAEPDADVVTITATDADPARAAKLANAFADEYVLYRTEAERRRVAEGADLLRQQLSTVPQSDTTQRAELSEALRRVIALRAVTTGDSEVVDRAQVPESPASPKPRRDGILGLLLGLVLGLALAFLLDLLDRRLKDVESFERLYGFKALTTIPERPKDPSSQRDRQAALEPFRILRNALGGLSWERPVRVVLVTSAVPGEGKSTTAAGLARAIALSGQSVALVEADLRRPTFHQQFDLQGERRGLTTAIVSGAPVRDVVRTVLPGLRTLVVLPAGPTPPNSAELLRSPEFARVLHELLEEVDVVVLDAPPLLPVADSQVLLDHELLDAALIVGRAYHTSRDEARRCRSLLSRHRQRNLGLVVNGLKELDAGYDYYGSAEEVPGTGRLSRA